MTDRPRGSVSGKCAATTRLASGGDQSGHATRQQFSIAISRNVPLSFNGMRPDGYRTPPEWVVATSLCQSAGRYPPPHGILKENLLWVRTFDTIEELRAAPVEFATRYNETWLVARHGYRTPAQVRADQRRVDQDAVGDLQLAARVGSAACLKTGPLRFRFVRRRKPGSSPDMAIVPQPKCEPTNVGLIRTQWTIYSWPPE